MAHPSHRWTYREGTLVDEPSRTTSSSSSSSSSLSSSSSSHSLREIVPEKKPIPVIDLSDDESVEGPEMALVVPRIGLGTSIEEDLSEPTRWTANYGAEKGDFPGRCPVLYSSPGTSTDNSEGRYARDGARSGAGGTRKREREIMELIDERDWLRQFIAQFLGTTRDSVDRARVELESRPGCSGSQCPQVE
ncbi:hypothetical protein M9H77_24143 [Catharanthus roseus]|uniref:Uncharacterized protein n=1 Tax=Catharanthus roseus TaxID=4058 RepID=A0ACC0AX15_CATRO|nr:hypothetical protein M9H77_24143 [Catharanthus roseus]